MPVSEEEVREELVALAVALDGLREAVEALRGRLGDDFPPEMVSREVPSSFSYNADGVLETVRDELAGLTALLRSTAVLSSEELYGLWLRETS